MWACVQLYASHDQIHHISVNSGKQEIAEQWMARVATSGAGVMERAASASGARNSTLEARGTAMGQGTSEKKALETGWMLSSKPARAAAGRAREAAVTAWRNMMRWCCNAAGNEAIVRIASSRSGTIKSCEHNSFAAIAITMSDPSSPGTVRRKLPSTKSLQSSALSAGSPNRATMDPATTAQLAPPLTASPAPVSPRRAASINNGSGLLA